MAGRPPSSYAYPKLWIHVAELGLNPTTHAIRRLRSQAPLKDLGLQTQVAVRLIDKKLSQQRPKLLEHATAHDIHAIVSHFRVQKGLSVSPPANDIVRFDHQVVGLSSLLNVRVNENHDPFEQIALRSGFAPQVIADAAKGRLLPARICNEILAAVDGRPGVSVRECDVDKQLPPATENLVLVNVMAKLAQ